MLELILDSGRRRTLRVLCVGAHCDDIEIGCGATLRALQARGRRPMIDWVVLSGTNERRGETRRAMRRLVRPAHRGESGVRRLSGWTVPGDLRARSRPSASRSSTCPTPDLIFCHERDDRHQDHRVVNEMIWNTFRRNVVLEYEIPKWDGGLGQPNVYVPVSAKDADRESRCAADVVSFSGRPGIGSPGKRSWRCCGCAAWSVVHPAAMRKRSTVASSFSRASEEIGCPPPRFRGAASAASQPGRATTAIVRRPSTGSSIRRKPSRWRQAER